MAGTELAVEVLDGPSPAELAEVANREHALARQSGVSMVEHAIRAGEALAAAKAQVRHGEWLPWLKANFKASERTAHVYMKVAANPQHAADLGESSLRKALDAVSASTAERIVASDENEWYTPAKYIVAARDVMGGIDLDPASSAEANEIVGAASFFTAADHPFLHPWSGRIWLNPPYGGEAGAFVNRLVDEFYAEGNTTSAVVLVNAHCTDTEWFRPLFNQLLCFTDHRIDFVAPAGREKKTTSTHGSVFAYFGADVLAFVREFSQFGAIVRPV